MTAVKQHPGAAFAVAILLAGWVASVAIRTWQRVEVNVVAEMIAAGTAAGILYSKMSGRPPGSDEGATS